MRFLIATQGALILWDGQTRVLQDTLGLYYGISWDSRQVYVVSRSFLPHRVQVLDRDFVHAGPVPLEVGNDPHQCLWWDGTLYVTDTSNNQILTWDGERAGAIQYLPRPDAGHREEHINSIWCDGERFFVVEHRHQEMPKRVRVFDLGFELVDTLELDLPSLVGGLHNVYVEDGTLFTLGPHTLAMVELAAGRVWEVRLPGVTADRHYLRGLARVEGLFFVGVSRAAPRNDRDGGDAEILVLDDGLSLVERIPIEGYGQLLEIRVMNGVDRAHNGIPCRCEMPS